MKDCMSVQWEAACLLTCPLDQLVGIMAAFFSLFLRHQTVLSHIRGFLGEGGDPRMTLKTSLYPLPEKQYVLHGRSSPRSQKTTHVVALYV